MKGLMLYYKTEDLTAKMFPLLRYLFFFEELFIYSLYIGIKLFHRRPTLF